MLINNATYQRETLSERSIRQPLKLYVTTRTVVLYSSKHPGCLDKSIRVGAYLFYYLLQELTRKWMILAGFRLIASHIELSM